MYYKYLSSLDRCVAVYCSVLQCVAAIVIRAEYSKCSDGCCTLLQCDAECCSVLQCVVVCCSVLQCVAAIAITAVYSKC